MGWCIPNVCWWEFLLQIFSHISGFVDLWVVQESGFVRGWKLNLYKQHQFFSIIADEPPPPPQPSKHLEASEKISKWKKYSQLTECIYINHDWVIGQGWQGYNINTRRKKVGSCSKNTSQRTNGPTLSPSSLVKFSFQYIITFSELPFQCYCFGQEKPP